MGTVLVKGQVKVKHFEFVNYANGLTSIVKLANQFGQEVWYSSGDTTGDNQRSGPIGWIQGFQELTHTDGFVLVYFD